MKKSYKVIVGAFCALLLAVSAAFAADTVKAAAAPVSEQWTVSLGGVGSTATVGDGQTDFGVDLSIGRTGKLFLPLEAGVRQGVVFESNDIVLNTSLYADWTLFSVKKTVDVFAGANLGLVYGDTKPVWDLAPEAGLRVWVKKDVAVLARVEYPYDLTNGEWVDALRYFLGFSVRW